MENTIYTLSEEEWEFNTIHEGCNESMFYTNEPSEEELEMLLDLEEGLAY